MKKGRDNEKMGCDLHHLPTQAHTCSVGPSPQVDRIWSLFGRWENSLGAVETFVRFNRELGNTARLEPTQPGTQEHDFCTCLQKRPKAQFTAGTPGSTIQKATYQGQAELVSGLCLFPTSSKSIYRGTWATFLMAWFVCFCFCGGLRALASL